MRQALRAHAGGHGAPRWAGLTWSMPWSVGNAGPELRFPLERNPLSPSVSCSPHTRRGVVSKPAAVISNPGSSVSCRGVLREVSGQSLFLQQGCSCA